MLFRLLLLVALILPALSFGEEPPASIDQITQQLDRARATIDSAHKSLEDPNLGDGELRLLRNSIDPLRGELEGLIDRLTPRLAAVDARLKELAPAAKPAEPPKPAEAAPPQPPPRPAQDARPSAPKTEPSKDAATPDKATTTKPAKNRRCASCSTIAR